MTDPVVVYTKQSCPQCTATLRRLGEANVAVVEKPAEEYVSLLTAMGHKQAPVVMTGVKHWSGYRPDLIDEVIEARRTN